MKRQRSAFTLIELLVVVAIIGVLAALLFPVVGGAILGAGEVECQNHLSQLAKVVAAYCAEHHGSFPLYAQNDISGSASNWLYGLTSAGTTPDFNTGILISHKYIGTEDILYCPVDRDRGLVREQGALMKGTGANAKAPTSYVINASITYGGERGDAWSWSSDEATKVRSRKISDFDPVDFLFIEQSAGKDPDLPDDYPNQEPHSAFDKGYMTPNFNKYALTNRHHGGGFVSCMDGHVEWFNHEKFTEGMKKVYGSEWYRNAPTRPSNTPQGEVSDEEIGARWNPG